jgi:hypothetical protein
LVHVVAIAAEVEVGSVCKVYLPGAQRKHAVAASNELEPAEHLAHVVALVAPWAVENLPATQATHKGDVDVQCLPAMHCVQLGAQSRQVADEVAANTSEYLPTWSIARQSSRSAYVIIIITHTSILVDAMEQMDVR